MKKKGKIIFVITVLAVCLSGCEKEPDKKTMAPEVSIQKEEKVRKERIELPEAYLRTEAYRGDFTRSPEGRLRMFLEETSTHKVFYYDLDEKDEWVKGELKNETIHKILTTVEIPQRRISNYQRGNDGKLYCIYERADAKENPYAEIGKDSTKVYLVCLGEDGSEFKKYRLEYSNSSMPDEEINYIRVMAYCVLEDGKVLIQYEDCHSELYSPAEKSVVHDFTPKTSKYGLLCADDDIYRVGEDWMSIDLVDANTEETIQSYKHSFSKVRRGTTLYYIDGFDNMLYFCDTSGIFYLDKQKNKEFELIEGPASDNVFGTDDLVIYGFKADEYGSLYISYTDASKINNEGATDDWREYEKLFKYTISE